MHPMRQGLDGAPTRLSSLELLEEARDAVIPLLRTAMDSVPETLRHIGGYHLGWWDAFGVVHIPDGGKAIRPALVLASARAVCGTAQGASVPAAAIELVHNFTLLHDDVMDGDKVRRRRPAAWVEFGTEDAILAGDAMHALAFKLLAGNDHPSAAPAMARLADCLIEVCEGQRADYVLQNRSDVNLTECLNMERSKTGALLGCACAIGALYGGGDLRTVRELNAYGRALGLAFQVTDDLLGIWGDPAITGKPVGTDLIGLKKSLPVVAALTSATTAGAELAALYGRGHQLHVDEVSHAAKLVERAGGRALAQAEADGHVNKARHHLAAARLDPARSADLVTLGELVTKRDR
jgi:geranylgeranyl diphosphate synthase, type I